MSAIIIPITSTEEAVDRDMFQRLQAEEPEDRALSADNINELASRLDPLCCLPQFDLVNDEGGRLKVRHFRVMHTISEVRQSGSSLATPQQPAVSMMQATVLYCAYCSDISKVNITPNRGG